MKRDIYQNETGQKADQVMSKATQEMEQMEEIILKSKSGFPVLIFNSLANLTALAAVIFGSILLADEKNLPGGFLLAIGLIYLCTFGTVFYVGLKTIRPGEAMVLTLFGKYFGTLKDAGFHYVNPFCSAVPSPIPTAANGSQQPEQAQIFLNTGEQTVGVKTNAPKKKISLKNMTLDNQKQKINDSLGNPIIIGVVVIWRVKNTAKAVFNVDNYMEFLSIQCDSALRNIVRLYPYDTTDEEEKGEKSLRGSSLEIASNLRDELQEKVDVAGLEVIEARITHLAYAPEIAAAMLQRQQASAIVDARQLIVEGAVGMVEMALDKLSDRNVVHLDDERKAAMVSNLLVVLCGNRDAQPIVNSGTLY